MRAIGILLLLVNLQAFGAVTNQTFTINFDHYAGEFDNDLVRNFEAVGAWSQVEGGMVPPREFESGAVRLYRKLMPSIGVIVDFECYLLFDHGEINRNQYGRTFYISLSGSRGSVDFSFNKTSSTASGLTILGRNIERQPDAAIIGGNVREWLRFNIKAAFVGGPFSDRINYTLEIDYLGANPTNHPKTRYTFSTSGYDSSLLSANEITLSMGAARWGGIVLIDKIKLSGPFEIKDVNPKTFSAAAFPAVQIMWDSTPGKRYVIESRDGQESLWKTITAPIAGQSGATSHFLPARHPQEIFRVRELE